MKQEDVIKVFESKPPGWYTARELGIESQVFQDSNTAALFQRNIIKRRELLKDDPRINRQGGTRWEYRLVGKS